MTVLVAKLAPVLIEPVTLADLRLQDESRGHQLYLEKVCQNMGFVNMGC